MAAIMQLKREKMENTASELQLVGSEMRGEAVHAK